MNFKSFTLLFLALFLVIAAFSQDKKADEIAIKQVSLTNNSGKAYHFGSVAQLDAAFGKTKAKKVENETVIHPYYEHHYQGLTVGFDGKTFDETSITGSNYKLILDGRAYAVGNSLDQFKRQFPLSFNNRDFKNTSRQIYIQIKNTDAFITISYNKANIITEIWLGNNNS